MNDLVKASEQYAVYNAETQLLNCKHKYRSLTIKSNRDAFLHDWLSSRQARRSGLSDKALVRLVDDDGIGYFQLLDGFMRLIALQQGKSRLIDSTPGNVYYLQRLMDQFPESHFVHIVRSPYAVISSLLKLNWTGTSVKLRSAQIISACQEWLSPFRCIDQLPTSYQKRILTVRYEELVKDIDKELLRINQYLGLSADSMVVCDHTAIQGDNSAFGKLGQGISSAPLERWKKLLSPNDVSTISLICRETMERFGFEVTHAETRMVVRVYYYSLNRLICLSRSIKRYLREETVLGRFSVSPLELDQN